MTHGRLTWSAGLASAWVQCPAESVNAKPLQMQIEPGNEQHQLLFFCEFLALDPLAHISRFASSDAEFIAEVKVPFRGSKGIPGSVQKGSDWPWPCLVCGDRTESLELTIMVRHGSELVS